MTQPDWIRVLLADDHAGVRSGLRPLLEASGMEVVGEAGESQRRRAAAPSTTSSLRARTPTFAQAIHARRALPASGGRMTTPT